MTAKNILKLRLLSTLTIGISDNVACILKTKKTVCVGFGLLRLVTRAPINRKYGATKTI